MSEKRTIIEIDNVRIKEYDKLNVTIERLETYYSPIDKKDITDWRFKGYSDGVLGALKFIQRKGLLVNQKAISDLKSHLNEVHRSNALLTESIEGVKKCVL